MKSNSDFKNFSCIVFICIGLLACSSKESKPSQSVVRVNGMEITVHQLNNELRNIQQEVLAEKKQQLTKQALDTLIDRRLLVETAQQEKLDRDPEVMQAIERSKEQIIAQAYLQRRVVANATTPTREDIEKYFNNNPELFAERKQYLMRQVAIREVDSSSELQRFVNEAKSINEIVHWLSAKGIKFQQGEVTRTTDELPTPLHKHLTELSKGRPFMIRDGAQVILSTLTHIKDAPVSFQEASVNIERFLSNKRAKETVTNAIASLRATAKIVYIDKNFDQPANDKNSIAENIPIDGPTPARTNGTSTEIDGAIARGVAGLK